MQRHASFLLTLSIILCLFHSHFLPSLLLWPRDSPLSLPLSLLLLVNGFPVRRGSICFLDNQNMRNARMDVVATFSGTMADRTQPFVEFNSCQKVQKVMNRVTAVNAVSYSSTNFLWFLQANKQQMHTSAYLCIPERRNNLLIPYYLFNVFPFLLQSNICLYMMA